MTTFERIQYLAKKRGTSLSKVATDLGFSENLFYQWKKSSPKSDRLEKVADYFNVSTDYLLGRDEPNATPETDIEKALDNAMTYDGEPLTDNDRDVVRGIIEAYLKNKGDK